MPIKMVHVSKWSQDIEQSGCGAFAYLTTPADTTVTTAGTYYPIQGIFDNVVLRNFKLVSTPAIKYIDGNGIYFKLDWFATISSSHTGCTVRLGIKKNGVLQNSSIMACFCKTIGELYNVGGTLVSTLQNGDEIQLVVTADNNGDVISFDNYTTSINEFFDKL